ncbi:hypothetical protein CMI44_01295 [Candidatus Pacearchaeota archaeon]|jgi:hypothetical protein|nr:hypothetical protein [Candidatus Pacearchaeota archaeon]|tara:strand:+ start:138 stop:389 length:252 start_codon:yes stop_codon:yes gene_type:complete
MCSPKKIKCFKCFEWFGKSDDDKECEKCGDFECPKCGACMCDLNDNEKKVVLAMIHTYENFLKEKLGQDYDFEKHREIEEELN